MMKAAQARLEQNGEGRSQLVVLRERLDALEAKLSELSLIRAMPPWQYDELTAILRGRVPAEESAK